MPRKLTRRHALQVGAVVFGSNLAGCSRIASPTTQRTEHWSPSPLTPSPDSWPLPRCDSAQRAYVPHSNSLRTGIESNWQYESESLQNVLVREDVVFVGGSSVRALNASDGAERWHGEQGGTLLGVLGDSLYVWFGGGLASLAPTDGTVQWQQEVGHEISYPTVDAETLYYVSNGGVVALDRRSGKERWRFDADVRVQRIGAVDERAVYLGTTHGVAALGPSDDGAPTVEWHADVPEFATAPAVADRLVYAGTRGEYEGSNAPVSALATETGAIRWQIGIGETVHAPAVADGTTYTGFSTHISPTDASGGVRALDTDDGAVTWQRKFENGILDVFATDETVFTASGYTNELTAPIRALDAQTGDTRWTFEADTDARLLALAGDTLYVATDDGVLHALREA